MTLSCTIAFVLPSIIFQTLSDTCPPGSLFSPLTFPYLSILLLSLVGDFFGFTHSSCHETSFASLLNETLCVLDHAFVSSGVMEHIPKNFPRKGSLEVNFFSPYI